MITSFSFALLIIGGLFGGLVNYFFKYGEEQEFRPSLRYRTDSDGKQKIDFIYLCHCISKAGNRLFKSILPGVAAALMVPLFLSMGESSLVDSLETMTYKNADKAAYLILGFALIASISAPRFISHMTEKVLQDVKNNTEKTNQLEAELNDAIVELHIARAELALTWNENERGLALIDKVLQYDKLDEAERNRLIVNKGYAVKRVSGHKNAYEIIKSLPNSGEALFNKICYLAKFEEDEKPTMYSLLEILYTNEPHEIKELEKDEDFKEITTTNKYIEFKKKFDNIQ